MSHLTALYAPPHIFCCICGCRIVMLLRHATVLYLDTKSFGIAVLLKLGTWTSLTAIMRAAPLQTSLRQHCSQVPNPVPRDDGIRDTPNFSLHGDIPPSAHRSRGESPICATSRIPKKPQTFSVSNLTSPPPRFTTQHHISASAFARPRQHPTPPSPSDSASTLSFHLAMLRFVENWA